MVGPLWHVLNRSSDDRLHSPHRLTTAEDRRRRRSRLDTLVDPQMSEERNDDRRPSALRTVGYLQGAGAAVGKGEGVD